jgi:radical SAM superfamily enzyme YgiQ (UPF0313 family)
MKKFNILLIDLGDNRNERNEPIGIECISNELIENELVDVEVAWLELYDDIELYDIAKYDIIGMSINIGRLDLFNDLYNMIRNNEKHIPIVAGGNIPTYAYAELLLEYNDLICVIGEGELSFKKIVEAYINDSHKSEEFLNKIPNIAYYNQKNLVVTEREVVDISNSKALKRSHKILEVVKQKKGIVRIEGSRGCSWSLCSFCCIKPKYGDPRWRGYPVEKIIEELVDLSNKGFLSPYFTDEDFFGQDYERVIQLSKEIIRYKDKGLINKDMNFFISIMASDLKSEIGRKALGMFKDAGLREVFLGIESLEDTQIKRYKKKANSDSNINAISFVKSLGLQLDTGFILFDPEMTFDELQSSISYIGTIGLQSYDSRSLKRLRLQPMTEVTKKFLDVNPVKLHIDQLEYPYKFSDVGVSEVYEMFSKWEDIEKEQVWKLQSVSRGEICEVDRKKYKELLSYLRNLDYKVLENIILYVKKQISEQKFNHIYQNYCNERTQFLNLRVHDILYEGAM